MRGKDASLRYKKQKTEKVRDVSTDKTPPDRCFQGSVTSGLVHFERQGEANDFSHWCVCVQAQTCRWKAYVSRASRGLTGRFDSQLSGIEVGVCTVSMTYVFTRCEAWMCMINKCVWGSHFCFEWTVNCMHLRSLSLCFPDKQVSSPKTLIMCHVTDTNGVQIFPKMTRRDSTHTNLLSPGGHTSCQISVAVSPKSNKQPVNTRKH